MKDNYVKSLEANEKVRRKFWKLITGAQPTAFQTYGPNGPRAAFDTFPSLNELIVNENLRQASVAMAINRLEGARTNDNVTGINALFVDDDSGASTIDRYLNLGCRPHLIVNTSPGKFHCYWKVSDCEVEDFSALQLAMAKHFNTDTSITDPCRAMRMPGTINWKPDTPHLVALMHADSRRAPYSVDELLQGLEITRPGKRLPAIGVARATVPDDWHEVESALASIPPDDRDCWLAVGMALHSTQSSEHARKLWDVWSQRSEKYDASIQNSTWAGFQDGRGRTLRTIFHLAKQGGWSACTSDELSFASLFAEMFGDRLKFDPQLGTWYRFDGVVWVQDSNAALQLLHDYITAATVDRSPGALRRFRSTAAMKAIVTHAQHVRSLHVSAADFDADPNLLAMKNGVVDLRTGVFRLATGADLLKRQADVAYDKDATAPEWKHFLKEVCCFDARFAHYLMACAGYTLYGHAREQKFFALRGSGANGKGVFTRLLKRTLGTYATTISPNVLSRAYSGNPNSPSPALAQLAGARMYLCSEGISDGKIDDAFLKQVSGGDELSARFSYGEMVAFLPVGKLWLTTNHALRISYSDEAMWRRVVPLPFDAEFRGARMDPELEERLWKNEAAGILNFFIRAAVRYAAEGFPEPTERSIRQVRSMRRQADPVEWWIRTHCSIDPSGQVRSSAAYKSYTDFARVKGIPQLGVKQFSSLLMAKGYAHGRDRAGAYYRGLVLEA